MTVSKSFRFEAAHSLPHLPPTHKCHRLHGHSYRFVVSVTGEIDPAKGWFIDYADIAHFVDPLVRNRLDHRNLNDVVPLSTAENLAVWLRDQLIGPLPGLSAIEVYETDSTSVRLEC